MGRPRQSGGIPSSARRRSSSGGGSRGGRTGMRVWSNDVYEADDARDPRRSTDPGAEAGAEQASYEQLPEDFDDEEIDEDAAFTAEDQAKWGDLSDFGRRGGGRGDDGDADDADDVEDEDFDNGDADPWEQIEAAQPPQTEATARAPGASARRGNGGDARGRAQAAVDVDTFLASGDEDDDEEVDSGVEDEELDGQQHARMLRAAGVGEHTRKRKLAKVVLTEAYPESEYNLNPALGSAGDTGLGAAGLSVADLARGLTTKAVPSSVRAKLRRLETAPTATPLAAPVPPAEAAKAKRIVAYAAASEHVTRWQPLVKANREARTLVFPSSRDSAPKPAASTGALAATFTPDTELEQQVAALLNAGGAATSSGVRAAEAAELQAVAGNSNEARERAARLAKMRALLFYHESKAKRMKNIKSKGYHRHQIQLAKRALRKLGDTDAGQAGGEDDVSAAALEAAELARMQERFGLKHRNTSRWARRLLAKGLSKLPATRQALAEQLRLGEQLRAKPLGHQRGKAGGSDDEDDGTDASDDDDDGEGNDDLDDDPEVAAGRRAAKHAGKARLEAMHVLEDAEQPAGAGSGLMSLPFMQRAQAKARAHAAEAAKQLLAELDGGDAQPADGDADHWDVPQPEIQGRMTFGGAGAAVDGGDADGEEELLARGSDESDGEFEQRKARAAVTARVKRRTSALAGVGSGAAVGKKKKSQAGTSIEVPLSSSGQQPQPGARRRGAQGGAPAGGGMGAGLALARSAATQLDMALGEEPDGDARTQTMAAPAADTGLPPRDRPLNSKERRKAARAQGAAHGNGDICEEVVPAAANGEQQAQHRRGGTSQAAVPLAPQPAGRRARGAAADTHDAGDADADALVGGVSARQRAVIAAAFAGDDVAAEFAATKAAEVAAELPDDGTQILASAVLPGWGAWAGEQTVPKAAKQAAATAKARAEAAAASRADAGKPHVIVSEKFDRKAAAYTVPALPFPYSSREVFDSTLRQPLSREVNTDASFRELTRPKVLATPGALIAPLKFRRVQPIGANGGERQPHDKAATGGRTGARKPMKRR